MHTVSLLRLGTELRDRLLQRQGCAYCPLRRLLHSQWRAEKRHQTVARQLVHRALIAMDLMDQVCVELIHEGKERFLPELHAQRRIADQVSEQHRHVLALPLEGAAGAENLFGEVLRGVTTWVWRGGGR